MNTFELALLELKREGVRPTDKNYAGLWEKRVYKINNYLMKSQGHLKRGHKQRI